MLLASSAPRLGVLLTPHCAHISPSPRTSAEAEGPGESESPVSVMIRVRNLPLFYMVFKYGISWGCKKHENLGENGTFFHLKIYQKLFAIWENHVPEMAQGLQQPSEPGRTLRPACVCSAYSLRVCRPSIRVRRRSYPGIFQIEYASRSYKLLSFYFLFFKI